MSSTYRLLAALAASACACNAPPSSSVAPASTSAAAKPSVIHPADTALRELADAFERKDAAAVRERISDAWSGSRFWGGWTDEGWRAAAASLRGATVRTGGDTERVYSVAVEGRERLVIVRLKERWVLDYDSFQGPFPHE
ncbi:MAG: hypothetical protein EOP08_01805 [Proteobacteria bacterium]|nr:MAG: hypothetical protein EOP08_01805 [Pseudomonadota bacterium]